MGLGHFLRRAGRMPPILLALPVLAFAAGTAHAADARLGVAPYVDLTNDPDLAAWAKTTGQKGLTLAFLNAQGACQGGWPIPEARLVERVAAFRAAGGVVILSSGGWNADDLAERCATADAMADQYDAALARLGIDHLDIDAEDGDVHDNLRPAIVAARTQGLRRLQDRWDAKGKALHLSFTLAVRPDLGMRPIDLAVLRSAVADGVRFDVVNLMTMDYRDGKSAGRMGPRSLEGLVHVRRQLESLLPGRTDAQYWAMIAATPMIGQNDAGDEVFTLADAALLRSFADQHDLAGLSFWQIGRDTGICPGDGKARNDCSGQEQAPNAYAQAFSGFAGRR
ncbi:glycosyl hydrolase family 18 protein [Nitrospirillum sp. BR 11164]|uniref:glycosyl hydrolase family 18 protein n=1 Tax=Nitrospirillum sp. BR 11164 TaxID=3104324 RepID=UPI002AFF6A2A|nr:glycosyl hydrolase family 18 protein [Nitrospirillum sp. BR 11164]MEA1650819.1 glycosyl hydrolase family 18 protein [Nitrospirillum sp. BR 11164]